MKKYIYIILFSTVLASCGGSGGDTPPPPPENTAPTIPTLKSPTNKLLCIDNQVTFSWNASTDKENNAITYQIQVAKNNQFTEGLLTQTSSTTSKIITLEKGVEYFWRVKATDSKNASSNYSSTFQLYTEGEGEINHLPFTPTLVSPTMNELVQTTSTTLKWSSSDVDGDALTYDIYFGTANPPITTVATNQTATSYSATLTASTTYYWKIVVKDNNGGQATGQIWSFKTD